MPTLPDMFQVPFSVWEICQKTEFPISRSINSSLVDSLRLAQSLSGVLPLLHSCSYQVLSLAPIQFTNLTCKMAEL